MSEGISILLLLVVFLGFAIVIWILLGIEDALDTIHEAERKKKEPPLLQGE